MERLRICLISYSLYILIFEHVLIRMRVFCYENKFVMKKFWVVIETLKFACEVGDLFIVSF